MKQRMRTIGAVWLRVIVVMMVIGGLFAACAWTPFGKLLNLEQATAALAPFRHLWYALPIVAAIYVALGFALVPVLLLITATGITFGPWLGPLYAMTGCLASASTGFGIGRAMGLRRVQRFGGARVERMSRALERNGTMAVFLLRKIPAPFLLSNIVAGASRVRYRDFVLGTILGMGAGVVALAGFGSQVVESLRHPSPAAVAGVAVCLVVPLTLAWLINRTLRRRRHASSPAVAGEGLDGAARSGDERHHRARA